MTNQLTAKIRFVRCPRCHRVLPEVSNVPVYQCGGCDTVLEVKKRKNGINDTRLHLREMDVSQKNKLVRGSEDEEAQNSSQEEALEGELPVDKISGAGQKETKIGNEQQDAHMNYSTSVDGESSAADMEETEVDTDKCLLEHSNRGDQDVKLNKSLQFYDEDSSIKYFRDEVDSSTKFRHYESEEPSPLAGDQCEVEKINLHSEQNKGNEVPSSIELQQSKESSLVDEAHGEADEKRNCLENNGRDQSESGDCNRENPAIGKFSDQVASSNELICQEFEDSSPVVGTSSEVDEDSISCFIFGSLKKENLLALTHRDSGMLSQWFSCKSNLTENIMSLHNEQSEQSQMREASGFDHVSSEETLENIALTNGRDQRETGDYNREFPVSGRSSDQVSSSNELTCREVEDSSIVVGTSNEVDEDSISRFIFGSLKKETLLAVSPGDSGITSQRLSGESNLTGNLMSPHNEELEQSQMRGANGFDHVSCEETVENIVIRNRRDQSESGDYNQEFPVNGKSSYEVSSFNELTCQEFKDSSLVVGASTGLYKDSLSSFTGESLKKENLLAVSPGDSSITSQRLSGKSNLRENLMSPRKEQLEQSQMREAGGLERVSSEETLGNIALSNPNSMHGSKYAYDGSVSSYDETDDQVSYQYLRLLKGKYEEGESSKTKARPRKDESRNKITSRCPESVSTDKKPYAMKGYNYRQDEFREPMGHGRPVRNRKQFEMDEHLPRAAFHSRDSQIGYEYGSSSNYARDQFQCSTSFNLPPKPQDLEEEKMKLRKMVLDLKDQLNRTRITKGHANGGLKHIPLCYHALTPEVDTCHDLSHTRYKKIGNQRKGFPNQSQFSRIPFSAEATISRPRMGHSCLHCCPHDWHCSAPLPPHVYREPCQLTAHLYCSSSLCPHHNTSSEFSLDNFDHEVQKYFGERKQSVKRHVLPVASAAPFILCYHCSELLQLPADFLLFKKRCNQLRCSACSFLLKFSLQTGNRIVRYTDHKPDLLAPAPPPSEVDDCSDVNKGRKSASASFGGNCPHAEPVCYSDDYGRSICKSCSTEGEHLSVVLPFDVLKRESNNKKTLSGNEHMEGRKPRLVLKESQNRYKNPVETFATVGPSSNISKADKSSSEIEEFPQGGLSPLHRLMGYSSAREVIN